jgi:hypothetical protein
MGASERCQARVAAFHDSVVAEVLVLPGEFLRAVGVVADASDDNLGFGEELLEPGGSRGASVVGEVGDVVRVAADPVHSGAAMRDDPILDVPQVLLLDGPEQQTRGVGDRPRVQTGPGALPLLDERNDVRRSRARNRRNSRRDTESVSLP